MKPKASTGTLAVLGLVGVAGVAGVLFVTGREPSSPPGAAPTAARSGPETAPGVVANPRPGRLPSIAIAEGPADGRGPAPAPGSATPSPEPTVEALAARLAELEARLAAAAPPTVSPLASVPALSAFLPPSALASLPPSKPAPTVLEGVSGEKGGPVLYDPGPPWPFHGGLRGADPPHVAGAGCGTCETGSEAANHDAP
ncbi:hypothetical protein L6V77_19375 [Myxococcota bacterium]|nr:hypothetical protein [Myxococcota bacterium]